MILPVPRDSVPPAVVDYLGPIFVANFENVFLMGALSIQGYYYWSQFSALDRPFIKFLAISPIFVELAQTIIVLNDGFVLFCRNFTNLDAMFDPGLFWFYLPIIATLTSFLSKVFYTWRLYTFSQNKWVSGWIFSLAVVSWGGAIATSHAIYPMKDFRELMQLKVEIPGGFSLMAVTLCDISIMFAMIWFLRRSSTGFKRTDALLWRIISLSLETGTICSIFTVTHLILWFFYPNRSWHFAVAVPEGKLYAMSLLVILNQRASLRGATTDVNSWSVNSGPGTGRSATLTNLSGGDNTKAFVNVEVTRETYDEFPLASRIGAAREEGKV